MCRETYRTNERTKLVGSFVSVLLVGSRPLGSLRGCLELSWLCHVVAERTRAYSGGDSLVAARQHCFCCCVAGALSLFLSRSLVLSVYLSLSARCIVGVLAFNLTAQFHWPAWETRTLARARATVVDSCAPLSFSLNYIRCIVLKLTRKTDLREDPFVVPLFMKRT